MGDGHHVWASAEWLMMIRNGFVREDTDSRLVVGAGIPGRWLGGDSPISFGPAPTSFGTISIDVKPGDEAVSVRWKAHWRRKPKAIEVSLPGFGTVRVDPDKTEVTLTVGVSV